MNSRHKRKLVFGLLWFCGGILVTGVSAAMADDEGGSYVAAWGAVLYGLIQIVRGPYGLARNQADEPEDAIRPAENAGVDLAFERMREDEGQRAGADGR